MVSGDPNLGIEMTLILKRRIINEVSSHSNIQSQGKGELKG